MSLKGTPELIANTMSDSDVPALRAVGITKSYPIPGGRLPVLTGVDLEVPRGTLLAIVGVSGSGKSTLLNLLGTLDHPDEGTLELAGQGVAGLDEAGLKSLKAAVMLDAKRTGADPRGAWREVEKSIEIARELEKFRVAGIDVRYEVCDLADAGSVRALVSRVEREIGPVRGIVHGAGWESACRFEKKTAEGFAATFGPKCVGLEHLLAAVDRRSLGSLVAFGSTSGRLEIGRAHV